MVEKIVNNKGGVYLNSTLQAVYSQNNKITKITTNNKEFSGSYFISTVPVSEFVPFFNPCLNGKIIKDASSLIYRCIIFIFQILND